MVQKVCKHIAVVLALVLLVSMFCTSAVAAELPGGYASTEIPELRNVTWLPLQKVVGTDQTAKYFIIRATVGTHTEELYVSFPKIGGFRVQSKHETQQTVESSNVGLFEPATVAAIDYKRDAAGNVVMVGADGTIVQYAAVGDGFSLTVLNSNKEQIVAITHKQIYFAYDRTDKAVGSRVELPLAEKEAIYGGGEKFNDTNQVGHSFSLTNANPIVKGMMVAYPYQLALASINNQYLFCDDFLVCAVTEENAHTLKVHLPKAEKWYSLFTNDVYKGGQSVVVEAPTTFMPVFVRNGAVKAINLPESMELMTEMHDEEGTEFSEIPALLVTPPEEKRTSVIYVKDGASEDFRTYASHTETYVNAPKGDTAFTITNTDGSKREIVLAIGVTAAAVSYDGTALTRLKAMPTYFAKEYGYYVDLDGKTHIFLPAGWKEITITKGDAAYTSYALKPVTADAMKKMFDKDITTGYQMPTAKNSTVVFALDGNEAKTVGRMEIKWMTGFWHTYDIEYSVDGENWELLLNADEYTVKEGAGGFDIVEFSPVTAKQFRITTVERGDTTPAPAIYTLNVCAPDPFTAIAEANPDDDEWKDWEDWEDTDEENKKKKKKKVVVAHTAPSIWWTILPIGGGVLAATGITLFIILFLKKKKKKQAEEAIENDTPPQDDIASDIPTEL